MRRLRHRLVQRLVAVALLMGLGAAWAPTARADGSGRMDADAARAALLVAADAPTLALAADRFTEAYVANGGSEVDAATVFHALAADGFGAPDPLVAHMVPGRMAAPAPPARTLALPPTAPRAATVLAPTATVPTAQISIPATPQRVPSRPRAP